MRRGLLMMILALLPVAGGCAGTIRVEAVDGAFRRVADRHDAYIQKDAAISELERSIYLRDTQLLRKVLDEAKK